MLLPQLRQVLPSRQSSEVAKENKQPRPASKIAEGKKLPVGIGQGEAGRSLVKQVVVQNRAFSSSPKSPVQARLRLKAASPAARTCSGLRPHLTISSSALPDWA